MCIRDSSGRPRAHFIADAFTGFHVFIVGGIIATAAATEEILLHPTDAVHTEFLIMFVGGLALFFGGIAGAAFRAYGIIAKERIAAGVVVAIAAAVASSFDGVIFLIIVDVVLAAAMFAEHQRIEPRANNHADVTTKAATA